MLVHPARLALLLLALTPAAARADGPAPIACTESALVNAVNTGGDYAYQANCTLSLNSPLPSLPQGRTLALDAGTFTVEYRGPSNGGFAVTDRHFMDVAGTLTLRGMTLRDFKRGNGFSVASGTPGTPGTDAANDSGAAGGKGGDGGDGPDQRGGVMVVAATGTVTLDHVSLRSNGAYGFYGGAGGAGGDGGSASTLTGPGGAAGAGGRTGKGGDGYGGAIASAGRLAITDSLFDYNTALGGDSYGSDGGIGGYTSKGKGGRGGDGSVGNDGGLARGGAIYNTGTLDIAGTTFTHSRAESGRGKGGNGANGGGTFTSDGTGGDGGNGAVAGRGGEATGGAVYSTVPFTVSGGTTSDNQVIGRAGYSGSRGVGGNFGQANAGADGTAPNTSVDGPASNPDYFPAPDSGTPKLAVGAPTLFEPDTGTADAVFEVTLRPAADHAVTVDYATHDGTATAGKDYTSRSGTLTFAAGEVRKTVVVPVLADDDTDEPDETFSLDLTNNAAGTQLPVPSASATIQGAHKLVGTLRDRKGNPIPGATVLVHGQTEKSLTTDAAGRYETRLYTGTYSVEPVAPPPDQPTDEGAWEPQESDDCLPIKATCFVRMTADRTASFAYVFKVPLKGVVKDPAGKGIPFQPIRVQGKTTEGVAYDVDTTTSEDGTYLVLLRPGDYTVQPHDAEDAVAPNSYKVLACPGKSPTADSCAVTVEKQPLLVDFASECEPKLDFKTSMIAVGCLVKADKKGLTYKAKGPVRINGIDFESLSEKKRPIEFDTRSKLVSADNVKFWVTKPGDKKHWLETELPQLRQRFSGRTVRYTAALGSNAPGGANLLKGSLEATLFGFPAHAPAVEIESTSGRTTLTGQFTVPSRRDAVLVGGLWKAPNEYGKLRITYPNAVRGAVTLTNDNGVQAFEGSVAPGSIIAFGSKSPNGLIGKYTEGKFGEAPPEGLVQLARVGFKYDLPSGQLRLQGTCVIHKGSRFGKLPNLPKKVLGAIGTNDKGEGALAALVFDLDVGFRQKTGKPEDGWSIDRFKLGVQGLNKLVIPPAFVYLQRLGIDLGNDFDADAVVGKLSGGLTWGPRIRSDLWFQELASLDVDGGFSVANSTLDYLVTGNAVLRVTNARLISGRFLWNVDANLMELAGETSLNLRGLFSALPLNLGETGFLGTAKITWSDIGFSMFGDGDLTVMRHTARAKARWTNDVMGFCFENAGWGISYDGGFRVGACDYGAFGRPGVRSRAAADAPTQTFTVAPGTAKLAVELRGGSGAPMAVLDGPGGLHAAVPEDGSGDVTDAVALVRDPAASRTLLFLTDPAPGDYTVSTSDGSTLSEPAFAQPLSAPKVKARVRAKGCATTLGYQLKPHPGQVVRFFEESPAGTSQVGKPVSKARGSFAFTPRAGSDAKRTLIAVVEQDGLTRARIPLGTFTAPGAIVKPAAGLRARLARGKVTASWRGGCGTQRWIVAAVSGAASRVVVSKGTQATLRVSPKARRVQVTVAPAVGGYGYGPDRTVTARGRR